MKTSSRWEEELSLSGYRITRPRRVILDIIAASSRPVTPMEIFNLARSVMPNIGLVTVYRTVEKLEDLKLIDRVHHLGQCQTVFRGTHGHQHLLVCTECGRSTYFEGLAAEEQFSAIGKKPRLSRHRSLAAVEWSLPGVSKKGDNMRFTRFFPALLLLLTLGMAACLPAPSSVSNNTIGVTVSILPEKYFVERIGGNLVSVNVMVVSGADPHTYEPKPAQMAALSNSAIFFRIGVEYENAWLDRISSTNPKMKIVDLSDEIQKLPMPAHQDAKGTASGEGLDPHIWTSPVLVKSMAERIYSELSALDPANEPVFKTNLNSFEKDIDALDLEIRTSFDSLNNRRFMVFHPGWAYFAKDYNLEEIPIEIGGTEPSASELSVLIDTAKAENIRVIFAQPEFSTQIAKYIAKEIGGEVILISNLTENWLDNLRQVAQTIKKSL